MKQVGSEIEGKLWFEFKVKTVTEAIEIKENLAELIRGYLGQKTPTGWGQGLEFYLLC